MEIQITIFINVVQKALDAKVKVSGGQLYIRTVSEQSLW